MKLLYVRKDMQQDAHKLRTYKNIFLVGLIASVAYLVFAIIPPTVMFGVIIGGVLVLWCGYFLACAVYGLKNCNEK